MPWPEAVFEIGGCGPYGALPAMAASWLRLGYAGSTPPPPDLRSRQATPAPCGFPQAESDFEFPTPQSTVLIAGNARYFQATAGFCVGGVLGDRDVEHMCLAVLVYATCRLWTSKPLNPHEP